MPLTVPTHVAIILDGNRRWAKAQGKLPAFGHQAGAQNIERIVNHCLALGIRYLTVWGFSTENWKRSPAEVEFLMRLFETQVHEQAARWHERDVRVRHMGQFDRLPPTLRAVLGEWIERTRENQALTVTLCLSYGGRDELLRAIQKLVASGIESDEVTEEAVAGALDSADLPDPDLIIRTSGEQRLSGFLPWQGTYSELYFTPTPWPAFDAQALDEAIAWYSTRERRFGG